MFLTEASIGNLLHNVRCGSKMPSYPKGFSTPQTHRLAAGILGLSIGMAGLIMALWNGRIGYLQVPWAIDRGASPEVVYTVAGLHNLGNNCFLNVILQALASCGCFRSFLQNVLDADDLETEERAEKLPLTVALVSLLEELCTVREERIVLSPRKVMLEMGSYVSNFNLRRQQDAAEAFILLLSSLEEEVLQCYIPHCGSLADVSASPCRVTVPKVCEEGESECKRWQRWSFGQFDGIFGSILTCKSCSSQLSVDFEFFRCLPIIPVLNRNLAMTDDCTLEDCLRHFTRAESLENYRCDRCSHINALRYLSLGPEEIEVKIRRICQCVKFDSCDCKSLLSQDGLVWPTSFSHASKQLIIARCPKVLCIQLQRASMNISGEIIKIQGHISFPLVLDLFPFTAAGKKMILETSEENILKQMNQREASAFHLNDFVMPWQRQLLPYMHSFMREDFCDAAHISDKVARSSHIPSSDTSRVYSKDAVCGRESNYGHHCSEACPLSTCRQSNEKVGDSLSSAPSTSYSYRLSSVVEHYGGSGSGHYAVYRKLILRPDQGDSIGQLRTVDHRWAYISDHEVSMVSEETVLGAEASLLFYERIDFTA